MVNKESWKKLIVVAIFAIAMAFLETVVVVYLRKLYYPLGFNFPLANIFDSSILNIEWVREFMTIVMLAAIGWLTGKKFSEKFAYFIYAFAIWDIFYYVWLLVTLHWPASFLTWDLLFLIPWPWAGPVLAPVILSITMILFTIAIIYLQDKKYNVKIKLKEWLLLIAGSLVILWTFLVDYGKLIFENGYWRDFLNLAGNNKFMEAVGSFSPSNYNWLVFVIGEVLILAAIVIFYIRVKNNYRIRH